MKKALILLNLILPFAMMGQFGYQPTFDRIDTLRGTMTAERSWWNLLHYELHVNLDIDRREISGKNIMKYKSITTGRRIQIELQDPMKITKFVQNGKTLKFTKDKLIYIVTLDQAQRSNTVRTLEMHFEGKPHVALRAPWQGGFTWSTDKQGKPFVATANQGEGSSLWWPSKDHPQDEPDEGIDMYVTTPSDLMDVSNGRLVGKETQGNRTTWHWQVKSPINNYGVNLNVADYAHFSEDYDGLNGELSLDYYVLKGNEDKAKKHFGDVIRMLDAFEHWFGPYPFYQDGYKLVEAPYLGMEHQSSVTYGNKYLMGYKGTDLSDSGWGLKFDFLIIHESGHEWFANSITNSDLADMWIHESFTAYSESLFLDYHYGTKAAESYVIGTRARILNDRPIIGKYGVYNEGSGDMYYKGANMLHTLRQLINHDDKWRAILTKMNKVFRHKTVSSKEIEQFLSKETGINLTHFFNQYLRDTRVPTLEYKIKGNKLTYRWVNCVPHFDMEVKLIINREEIWISPTTDWKTETYKFSAMDVKVDRNFYVSSFNILGE